MSESLLDYFNLCSDSYVVCERRFSHQPDNFDEDETTLDCEDDLKPSDSILQVTSRFTVNSKSSLIRRIEIERKKAQLANEEELAKARKMRFFAEADVVEALANLRLKTANLEIGEKLIAYSERGSSVTTLSTKASKIESRCRPPVERNAYNPHVKSSNANYPRAKIDTSGACACKTRAENLFNGICARTQKP